MALCDGKPPITGGSPHKVSVDFFVFSLNKLLNWIRLPAMHYCDAIMGTVASQITSLTIVYTTIYSDADQSKHQSSASLAFVWGIHRGPVNSPHKWPVTRKMFPFDDVIMFRHLNITPMWCRCYDEPTHLFTPTMELMLKQDTSSLLGVALLAIFFKSLLSVGYYHYLWFLKALIGWPVCCQPIRSHIRELRSVDSDLSANRDSYANPRPTNQVFAVRVRHMGRVVQCIK